MPSKDPEEVDTVASVARVSERKTRTVWCFAFSVRRILRTTACRGPLIDDLSPSHLELFMSFACRFLSERATMNLLTRPLLRGPVFMLRYYSLLRMRCRDKMHDKGGVAIVRAHANASSEIYIPDHRGKTFGKISMRLPLKMRRRNASLLLVPPECTVSWRSLLQ